MIQSHHDVTVHSAPALMDCSTLTLIAEVVPASSSIAGRALRAGAAMLVGSLSDPVAPKARV